jgi:glyoxylase-like metal-dependent hydrolase (beta-lactamase superfamily II)
MADVAPEGVVRVRANNPSALTLDGTNTYVVGRWVVDPGPLMEDHLQAVLAAAPDGIEGVVITHDHPDHAQAAPELARRAGGVPVSLPKGGETVGPFEVVATPGHSADHVSLLLGRVCFCGDTVLGEGSVFISPGEGSLAAYLDSLRRLRELDLETLCPGHGPFVDDPRAKLDEYIEHRLERERKVIAALESGARTRDEILDQAWDDVDLDAAPFLRDAAGATLQAHLEKLADEGRLPPGVRGVDQGSRGV